MAAGNAARFGENKLAAMVNGKPLIEHALDAIPRESFSRVLVVTQHENVEAAAKKFGFEALRNEHPERGQSETIRLGTAALSDCDALCFMVADQPMPQPHLGKHLGRIERVLADLARPLHVLQRRAVLHEAVELEHEAYVVAAVVG